MRSAYIKKVACIVAAILLMSFCSISFFACNNKTVTMSFVADGEDILPAIQGKAGSKITPPDDPVKEKLMFAGWYLNPEFSGRVVQIPSKMPKNDVTYYARFIVGVSATYKVIVDENDGFDARLDDTLVTFKKMLVANGCSAESDIIKELNDSGEVLIKVNVFIEEKSRVNSVKTILEQVARSVKLEFKGADDIDAENLLVGSAHLESAYVTMDSEDNYAVGLKFNEAGTAKFAEVTQEYLNRSLYIYIDGELYTQAIVNSQISDGTAVISRGAYGFDSSTALEMASRLQAGAFGVSLRLVQITNINAD